MEAISIGHTIIKDRPGRLEIVIPAKKNWLNLGALTGVIVFWWLAGGNIAFNGLATHQNIEVYDWVWLCWGIAVILILLRNLWLMTMVKEIILFERDKLTIKKSGHPFVSNKIFKISKACRFAVAEQNISEDRGSVWRDRDSVFVGSGNISFEYGKNIIRFGEGLNQAEAGRVLEVLRKRRLWQEVVGNPYLQNNRDKPIFI